MAPNVFLFPSISPPFLKFLQIFLQGTVVLPRCYRSPHAVQKHLHGDRGCRPLQSRKISMGLGGVFTEIGDFFDFFDVPKRRNFDPFQSTRTKKFSVRVFRGAVPVPNREESVRLSVPSPEIRAPKLCQFWGASPPKFLAQRYPIFFARSEGQGVSFMCAKF